MIASTVPAFAVPPSPGFACVLGVLAFWYLLQKMDLRLR